MKQALTILFIFSFLFAFSQKNETVDLKWKIEKNENLNYSTVMRDIDTASFEMNFGGLFKALSDSTNDGLEKSKDLFKKFNAAIFNQDYITTLTNKGNGIINIIMASKPVNVNIEDNLDSLEEKEAEMERMMKAFTQGVMLRGSVYDWGGIHSFWVKSNQKNLIAILFELPKNPVKVGDRWSLDLNLIANDQNFSCDTSFKINEVTLMQIKQKDGSTVAVLKYNIMEYVKGDFLTPAFFDDENEKKETMIKISYQGVSEFSIDQGKWVLFDGIMSVEATGVMNANKTTKFTLFEEK